MSRKLIKKQKRIASAQMALISAFILTLIISMCINKDNSKTKETASFEVKVATSKTYIDSPQNNKTEEKEQEIIKQENEKNKINEEAEKCDEYYIKVNNEQNVVTIYGKKTDEDLKPVKAMTCSTGTGTPKSGVYSIQNKWEWGYLFNGVWGHYATKIVENILFHSVPYIKEDPGTLEYWEYDKLGTSASMGCVRLCVADAKWIFDNIPSGTPVEFYYSEDPGPLGKPEIQKISENIECRDWDPTDPDENNPWKEQKR